jgi:transposase
MAKFTLRVEAQRLYREENWSHHDIRHALGISKSTLYRWLNPRRDALYAARARTVHTCVCGKGMSRHAQRCRDCADDADRRNEFIRLVESGEDYTAIGQHFGKDRVWASRWVAVLKSRGYLPPTEELQRIRAENRL